MSTSDPIAKKNELLSTIPGSRQNEASVDAITERNQIRQDASTVLDEFGLPAKVSHKRSHSFTKDENRAEDSGHQAQFQERSEGPWPPSQFSALGQIVEHRSQNGNLVGTRRSSCESSASKEFPDSLHTGLNGSNHKIREDQEVSSHTMEKELPISDRGAVIAPGGISGWSHQAIAPHTADANGHDHEDEWQDMPAFAPYDLYDEEGKLIAKEARESDDEDNAYTGLGGAGKGYTRVQIDEDAQSATSMDDNTSYLFKTNDAHVFEEDEEQRDPLAQMQATKNLLTEGQRIAYVGVTKLTIAEMAKELDDMEQTKGTKKEIKVAADSMRMWGQQMMLRLYAHMDISSSGECMDLRLQL